MREDLITKSKGLVGASDLTLLARIKPGLVPSLESITYKSRAKQLLETLNGGRTSQHEYSLFRPLSDSVERVAVIHSFRVAVLEPEDKILLAVTFDGTWESYIRILWQKVGSLLDIIFCNTEGYVVSSDNTFEAWAGWVHRVQVETDFFFHTHGLTVDDVQYLRNQELLHRRAAPSVSNDLEATQLHRVTAESLAWSAASSSSAGQTETIRQGLQVLAVLFRLTDTYLPGTPDGDVLQHASRDLLIEFMPLIKSGKLPPQIIGPMRARFGRQLDWLIPPDESTLDRQRAVPSLPVTAVNVEGVDIQGGILRPYDNITHGCLLFFAFDDRGAAAKLMGDLAVTTEAATSADGTLRVNIALTYDGLKMLGLSEDQLAWFPQEFREGMAARAGTLGDLRANHPRRWRLPLAGWGAGAQGPAPRIEMSAVHLMIQLRVNAAGSVSDDPSNPEYPLHSVIAALTHQTGHGEGGEATPRPGARLLFVQPLRRLLNKEGSVVEHFGFADGSSDPSIDPPATPAMNYPNQVQLGEVLLGYPTDADFAPSAQTASEQERLDWLRNGSFLVLRKLSQNVGRFNEAVGKASALTGLDPELIRAKMLGRYRDGRPLVNPGTVNDFDYLGDANGSLCPFHAHIRRVNPRQPAPNPLVMPVEPFGLRRPRLFRRGMSYGPPDSSDAERGLVFMAYNASISEQFEVVQRWIGSGNSSGGFSGQNDPLLGVPEIGQPRFMSFEHAGNVHRIELDTGPEPGEEPEPFVRLEWGLYLFAPSVSTLKRLRELAAQADRAPVCMWSAEKGEETITETLKATRKKTKDIAIRAWKSVLEDPEAIDMYQSASAWAAIRQFHGGVLRTPYGVLVANRDLIMQVLDDKKGRFSVSGYRKRMTGSIGPIYLGLDDGPDGAYKRDATAINQAIHGMLGAEAFSRARDHTTAVLDEFIETEKALAKLSGVARWELDLDVKEVSDKVLARLCQDWFGLPTGASGPIVPGSWRWDWKDGDPAIYPSQFTAPSRFIFQPRPGLEVWKYACQYGKALTEGIAKFLEPYCAHAPRAVPLAPDGSAAPLAAAIIEALPGANVGQVARAFTGVLMGMLPTVDGNLRLSLNEWLRDGTFGTLRAAWAQAGGTADYGKARAMLGAPLAGSMQLRPSPELLWRTATESGTQIGGVTLSKGDVVVLSLVSATQAALERGEEDIIPIFGGNRADADHPTHACPGYDAGMGILLGMLAAMMDVEGNMRPSGVPLAFVFDGPVSGAPPMA